MTDDRELHDIAFQQSGDRVILEAVPSPNEGVGESLSAVGGLAALRTPAESVDSRR